MKDRRLDRTHDRGFTLVEVLIVTLVIGVVMTTLATVVTVILRTTPPTEIRINDARSVQGLVTWLPQDVDATPPTGFNTTDWPCAGATPAGHRVLTMNWNEQRFGTTNLFAASYRYEQVGEGWRVVRYACDDGGTGTMGGARRLNLTSDLAPWAAPAPVAVTLCKTAVDDATGLCPVGQEVIDPTTEDVGSLKLMVTLLNGSEVTIDAASKNPEQELKEDPNAPSTNTWPVAWPNVYPLILPPGQTGNVTVVASDADGDPMAVAIDTSYAIPTGLTLSTVSPFTVVVDADASVTVGNSYELHLIISDNRGGWDDATIELDIVNQPNARPVVPIQPYLVKMQPGETVTVPFKTSHGAYDPDGDTMTAVAQPYAGSLTIDTTAPHLDEIQVDITAGAAAVLGSTDWVDFKVHDDRDFNLWEWASIAVEIVGPTMNTPPSITPTDHAISLDAGDSTTIALDSVLTITDAEGDPMFVTIVAAPAGITATADGGLGVTIAADGSLSNGTVAVVDLLVSDIHGATSTATITVTIVVPPPPVSDCNLTGLTASPATVGRQGGGPAAHPILDDVLVTLTYTGTCDGLTLNYDTGHSSGLGIAGRVFSTSGEVLLYSAASGGTEKWTPTAHTLTASTTSVIAAGNNGTQTFVLTVT